MQVSNPNESSIIGISFPIDFGIIDTPILSFFDLIS